MEIIICLRNKSMVSAGICAFLENWKCNAVKDVKEGMKNGRIRHTVNTSNLI